MQTEPSLPLRVFVYGTLKPGGFYWARFAGERVREVVPAMMRGALYDLVPHGYPAMVEDGPAGWARGCVLDFHDAVAREALQGLDDLEGYAPTRDPAQNDYQRVQREAFAIGEHGPGESLGEVWTYVMSLADAQRNGGRYLSAGEWDHLKGTS